MKPGSGCGAIGADDDGRVLHTRLLRGEATATADLAARFLPPLVEWLRRAFPGEDVDLLETVAIDLILAVGRQPAQYDPERLSLSAYLRMAARGDVKNALERERRRIRRQIPLDDVELRAPVRNSPWASAFDPAGVAVDALADERLAVLREQFVGRDREVVDLMLDGERRTEVFADILGLQDRPLDEQVREVKRTKDRLKKRMQRTWRKMSGDD